MSTKHDVQSLRAQQAALKESYGRMQRWYRLQRAARDVHHLNFNDEQTDIFISAMRHMAAEMIPPRGDIE